MLLPLVQLAVQITERRVVYIAIMAHYGDAGLVIRLFCNAEQPVGFIQLHIGFTKFSYTLTSDIPFQSVFQLIKL